MNKLPTEAIEELKRQAKIRQWQVPMGEFEYVITAFTHDVLMFAEQETLQNVERFVQDTLQKVKNLGDIIERLANLK